MLILASLLGLNLTSFAFGCGPFIQHDQNRFCRSEFGENLTNSIWFFYNFICIPYSGENQTNIILLFYHSTYIRYTYTSFFECYLSMKVHRLILGFFSVHRIRSTVHRERNRVCFFDSANFKSKGGIGLGFLNLFYLISFLSFLTFIVVCKIHVIHSSTN